MIFCQPFIDVLSGLFKPFQPENGLLKDQANHVFTVTNNSHCNNKKFALKQIKEILRGCCCDYHPT